MRASLPRATVFALALAAVACSSLDAACGWSDDRSQIRARLQQFAETVNGAGPGARVPLDPADWFTADVAVQLGDGTAPIEGREMLSAMAARLQPRTAEYTLKFEDMTIRVAPGGATADVDLTAEFIRRNPGTRQTMDAREFRLTMRREDGVWRIGRVEAVATLK